MRYVELQRIAGVWRVWATTADMGTLVPEGDGVLARFVPLTGQAPATLARYDEATSAFVNDGYTPPPPPAVQPSTRMSRLAFRSRFTEAEQVAFETAMESHPTQQVRAALRVFDKNLSDSTEIDLSDPRTQLGLTRLVTFGLLTAQRRTEILDPAWTPPSA